MHYDDSQLLDLLIDGDQAAIDRLDPEARERLEALRTIREEILAIDAAEAVAFRPDQIDSAVAALTAEAPAGAEKRVAERPQGRTIRIGRLAWAAALLVGILIAVFALDRGDRSTVYADVFGKVDVMQDGEMLVQDVDRKFRLGAGMLVRTAAGCWLNIHERFPCRAGQDTQIRVKSVSKDQLEIELLTGMLRIDAPPTTGANAPAFVVKVGQSTLTSRGAVYSVALVEKSQDHMIVDAGAVTLACGGTEKKVTPNDGAFRYTDACPCCPVEAKRLKIELAPRLSAKESCRSFPVQRLIDNAFEIAGQHHVPVLVTRLDGPQLDQCFGGDFNGFVERSRKFAGMVWLVLDPTKPENNAFLRKVGITHANRAVILDRYKKELNSGDINHDDDMCVATVCGLLEKARVKCKGCPLR